jgi:hypothetical protein
VEACLCLQVRNFGGWRQGIKVFLIVFLQKNNKNLLFLKKKKQKDFMPGAGSDNRSRGRPETFRS